jgi:Na+/H+ antiporter NhaC
MNEAPTIADAIVPYRDEQLVILATTNSDMDMVRTSFAFAGFFAIVLFRNNNVINLSATGLT